MRRKPAAPKRAPARTRRRKAAPAAPKPPPPQGAGPGAGGAWFLLCALTVAAAAFPVAATRLVNDEAVTGAFFAPLALWGAVALLGWRWSRPRVYAGDRGLVALTVLLLGLGVVEQLRLGTWAESWVAWRAYAPFLAGAAGFLACVRWLPAEALARALGPMRWPCWLAAVGVVGVLFVFGRPYRGGTFLPGQVNPTELAKVGLVLFAAGWLPLRAKGLSRTVWGVPFPPARDALALGFAWGVPLAGAVLVRDLGLALILCLTAVFLLTALTRRPAWLVVGLGGAVAAGVVLQGLSAHTAERFAAWLDPFADPLDGGWQIGQSLCAQYAGGLWGVGLGEGTPNAVPIVSNDFVYAAVAEEWGLAGCALLLLLYWLWLLRLARAGAEAKNPALALVGAGAASVLGVQALLNVAGVTKALPMTGITLPLLSQGGFSLLATLWLCGLAAAASKAGRRG